MTTVATAPTSMARFHFDPQYDASTVPSVDELVSWAMSKTTDAESPLHSAMTSVRRSRRSRIGVIGLLAGLMPTVAHRRDAALTDMVTASIRTAMEAVHGTMTEFGVDLREHRFLAASFEALVSYAVIAPIEMEQRRLIIGNPDFTAADMYRIESVLDEIDTEQRIAASHAGIRASLENDALTALLSSEDLGADRGRHVAAMKAAIYEVRQVDMRQRLVDMIATVEAGHA